MPKGWTRKKPEKKARGRDSDAEEGEGGVFIDTTDEGVLGLTQVDPSPVDESPPEHGADAYFPDVDKKAGGRRCRIHGDAKTRGTRRTGTGAGTLGLRLADHGAVWWLTRIQKYSSYAFAAFAGLHLANASLIPLATRSVLESNRYLLLTRPYYQSAYTEPLVIGLPLAAHITAGVALRFYRRRQALHKYGAETRTDKRRIPWPTLTGTSALGYALLPLAAFHTWTTRLLPLYQHGDSSLISLSYISHATALYPYITFSGFTALVAIGSWHFVWGAAKWMGLSPAQVRCSDLQKHSKRRTRWYTINLISTLVTGLWLAGSLGIVARDGKVEGWIGKEYDSLLASIQSIGLRVVKKVGLEWK